MCFMSLVTFLFGLICLQDESILPDSGTISQIGFGGDPLNLDCDDFYVKYKVGLLNYF